MQEPDGLLLRQFVSLSVFGYGSTLESGIGASDFGFLLSQSLWLVALMTFVGPRGMNSRESTGVEAKNRIDGAATTMHQNCSASTAAASIPHRNQTITPGNHPSAH